MRFEPINPNDALPARHTIYLAVTGGGKSQALKANRDIPRAGVRVVGWDHAGDHPGIHYRSQLTFLLALREGIRRGGGFRVFYGGPRSVQAWEWWCEVVWSILDGNVLTYAIAEELSLVSPSANKASPNAAQLLNEGRKFGLVFHGTSQKPQEVAKTYFDQAAIKYVGQQKGAAMRQRMAREIGVTPEAIRALNPLEFFRDDGSANDPELIKVPFREKSGVIWKP